MVAHSLSFPREVVHGLSVVKAKEVVLNTAKLVFADRSEDGEKEVIVAIVDVVVCGGVFLSPRGKHVTHYVKHVAPFYLCTDSGLSR